MTEEDDHLEFTVSFPSPSLLSKAEEEVEPVVFILGWEDSKDEELAIYSRLYESLGCITIRNTIFKHHILHVKKSFT